MQSPSLDAVIKRLENKPLNPAPTGCRFYGLGHWWVRVLGYGVLILNWRASWLRPLGYCANCFGWGVVPIRTSGGIEQRTCPVCEGASTCPVN